MVTQAQLVEVVRQARGQATKRGFAQAIELVLTLKDLDPKKQEVSINELVYLPHKGAKEPGVCVIASGDLAQRAQRGGADRVIEPAELDRLGTDKKEAKKVARTYRFFLAETSLMPRVGRALGPYLGPRGRMPQPVPPTAPIDGLIGRLRQATRARARGQLAVACRIGEESLSDEQLAENAWAVVGALERKLPRGAANIRGAVVKFTMSPPARVLAEVVAQ